MLDNYKMYQYFNFLINHIIEYIKNVIIYPILHYPVIECITIAGTFFSIFSIITLINIIKVRKVQRLRNQKEKFSAVCRLPAKKIASYNNVYNTIFNYYKIPNENNFEDKLIIAQKYFYRTINKYPGKAGTVKTNGKFPLACDKNWLRSENSNLQIREEEDSDFYTELKDKENILNKPANCFLKQVGIEDYPTLLASFGKQIFDNKTFDLSSVCWSDKENILRLNFKLGSYFNYVNYYELISKELYFHLYTGKIKCLKINDYSKKELLKLYGTLTFREALKDIDILKDFKKRPVKLGINVFVLMKKPDNNYCTFIQKRGETQVEYPGFYHIAPAGTFQPLCTFDENIVKNQFNFFLLF